MDKTYKIEMININGYSVFIVNTILDSGFVGAEFVAEKDGEKPRHDFNITSLLLKLSK